MSETTDHRPPAPPPQPSAVVAEPATVEAAAADWDDRTDTTAPHPGSYDARPHTLGRH